MKKIVGFITGNMLAFMPVFAFAQLEGIDDIFTDISSFIDGTLIPLVFAVALLVFLWGIFQFFILGGHDEEKRKDGRQLMMYSVLGFVLMVAIFGIVNLIIGAFNLDDDNDIDIPSVPTSRS